MNTINVSSTICFRLFGNISVGDKFKRQRMRARRQASHGGRRAFLVETSTRFQQLSPTHNTTGRKDPSATRHEDSGRERAMLSPKRQLQISTNGLFTELFVETFLRYVAPVLDYSRRHLFSEARLTTSLWLIHFYRCFLSAQAGKIMHGLDTTLWWRVWSKIACHNSTAADPRRPSLSLRQRSPVQRTSLTALTTATTRS